MHTIGLDFGTNYCRIACPTQTRPQAIPNALEELATPAWVRFTPEGRLVVGREAKPAAYSPGEMPFTGIKRKLASSESIWFGNGMRPPAEIAALLMQTLRKDAERALRNPVTGAVVTTPALAGTRQRANTREAAKTAGFEVVRLINETTAAALAYKQATSTDKRLLVYALGAGYFEVAIIESTNQAFKTLGIEGDSEIGGNAFDRKFANYILNRIKQSHHLDFSTNPQALWLLAGAAEEAKIKLSTEPLIRLPLPKGEAGPAGKAANLNLELTRTELENLLSDSIEATVLLTRKALAEAGLAIADIDDLLLVGGSTRLPLVQQKLQAAFNKKPRLTGDDTVVLGAAWQAAAAQNVPLPSKQDARAKPAKAKKVIPAPEKTFPTETPPESPPPRPDSRPVTSARPQVLHQARHLLRQGQHKQAVALLQSHYNKDPTNNEIRQLLAEGYYLRAVQLSQANRWEEAIQNFEKVFEDTPAHKKARQALVNVCLAWNAHLEQEKRWSETIHPLEKAFRHAPHNQSIKQKLVTLYDRRSAQHVKHKQWDEAIQDLEKALRYNPDDKKIENQMVKICLHRATQLKKSGRFTEALSVVNKGLGYKSGDKSAHKKLRRLRSELKHLPDN